MIMCEISRTEFRKHVEVRDLNEWFQFATLVSLIVHAFFSPEIPWLSDIATDKLSSG